MIRPAFFAALLQLTAFGGVAWADDIDFESGDSEWKGWSATLPDESGKQLYKPLAKWTTPVVASYDNDKPHGGSASLKLEFTADVPGMFSFRSPNLPVDSRDVSIHFFIRTKNMSDGLFSFDEMPGTGGQRVKSHWSAAKIPASEDWTEVSWQGQLDPSTGSLRLAFVFKSAPAGGCVWLDDLSIKSAP